MGLLGDYVRHKEDEARDKKLTQMQAMSAVLQSPSAPAEQKNAAWDFIFKTGGIKGPERQFFEHLAKPIMQGIGKLGQVAHVPGANKMEASASMMGKQKPQDPTQGGANGGAPNPMQHPFMSDEEVEKQREKIDTMKAQAAEQLRVQMGMSRIKQIQQLPGKTDSSPNGVSEADRQSMILSTYRNMVNLPEESPRGKEITNVELPPGMKDAFGNDSDPKKAYKIDDGKYYPEAPPPKADKPESTPAEVKRREYNLKQLHPDWDDTKIKTEAAKADEKALETKDTHAATVEKTAEKRLGKIAEVLGSEGAQSLSKKMQAYVPLDPSKPGSGKSIANPSGDHAVDAGAMDYIFHGKIQSMGLGKDNKGFKMAAMGRAYEVLADAGLDFSDLPAVQANVKGGTQAVAANFKMGASVQQFEETLKRNADIAKQLSKDYPRYDSKFANRVLNAWKGDIKGDPEATNLAGQLHGLAREWGKIMSGSTGAAGVPMSEAAATDLIFKNLSDGTLNSLIDNVIIPDANSRRDAIQSVHQRLIGDLRKAASGEEVKLGSYGANASSGASRATPKVKVWNDKGQKFE